MDEKKAKALVNKLIDIAYEAGYQHNSDMAWNSKHNVLYIGDEIVRHLTTRPSRAAGACADWKSCLSAMAGCAKSCPRYRSPPA